MSRPYDTGIGTPVVGLKGCGTQQPRFECWQRTALVAGHAEGLLVPPQRCHRYCRERTQTRVTQGCGKWAGSSRGGEPLNETHQRLQLELHSGSFPDASGAADCLCQGSQTSCTIFDFQKKRKPSRHCTDGVVTAHRSEEADQQNAKGRRGEGGHVSTFMAAHVKLVKVPGIRRPIAHLASRSAVAGLAVAVAAVATRVEAATARAPRLFRLADPNVQGCS
eukprot:4416538-Prymnesium_polylepis.1